MSRLTVFPLLLMAATIAAFPHAASGAVGPSHGPSFVAYDGDENDDDEQGDKARVRTKDAGSIEGEVVSVDYRTSRFSVRSGTTTYDVVVLPSTDFQGRNNAFRGIIDIKKGAHVNVMLSQRASTYVAQIIHLR